MSICGDNACEKCKYAERCVNSDIREKTNFQFMQTCSMEEMAKLIALVAGSNLLTVWRIKYHCADSDEDTVKMWLKEKHNAGK